MSNPQEDRWSFAQLSGYLMCADSDDPMEQQYAEYHAPDPKMLAEWVLELSVRTPQIIRDMKALEALDMETVLTFPDGHIAIARGVLEAEALGYDEEAALPAVVIATGDQVRAARKALQGEA